MSATIPRPLLVPVPDWKVILDVNRVLDASAWWFWTRAASLAAGRTATGEGEA